MSSSHIMGLLKRPVNIIGLTRSSIFIRYFTSSLLLRLDDKHDWDRYQLKPEKAGCHTVYREDISRLRTNITIPSNLSISVANGGGGGDSSTEPYLQPKPANVRYNPRLFDGGLLPRLDYSDEPVVLPDHKPRDRWAPHRAHFGQNDYIDILGDGKIHPRDFYTGPKWALGASNEFQRVCAQLNNPAIVAWLEEFEPTRLNDLKKRHRFLFKKANKRKNISFNYYRDSP